VVHDDLTLDEVPGPAVLGHGQGQMISSAVMVCATCIAVIVILLWRALYAR